MRRILRSAAGVFLVLGSISAGAQQTPDARALFDRVLRYQGGTQRLRGIYALHQRYLRHWRDEKGQQSDFTNDVFLALPDRVHLEISTPQGKAVVVITPSISVMVAAGQSKDLPGAWQTNWLTSLRRTYAYLAQHETEVTVENRGSEVIAGETAQVIRWTLGGIYEDWWIEPQSGRVLREQHSIIDLNGSPAEYRSDYSDFRLVDGFVVAFHTRLYQSGVERGADDVEAVEVNPEVDPRLFYRQPILLDQIAFHPAAASPAPLRLSANLSVASQPTGAQVYLDDVVKGTTSESEGRLIVDQVSPGSHRVRVTAAGYKEWTKAVSVEGGDTVAVEATLERAGPPPFSVADMEQMLQGGVSPKRAAALVKERGVDFAVDDAAEKRLRAAGADDALLLAIAKGKR
jgi:hypothetical protein